MTSNRGTNARGAIPENMPVLQPRTGDSQLNVVLDQQAQNQVNPHTVPASEMYGERYNMSHSSLGKAVIINNVRFKPNASDRRLGDRRGSDADAASMFQCLQELGFDVDVHIDVTKDKILAVFDDIAAEDHSDSDCFFAVLMSHGDENGLWATDRQLDIKEIMQKLGPSNCSTLIGKAKVFFIQCCRGSGKDPGCPVRVMHDRTVSDVLAETAEYDEYVREKDRIAEDILVVPSDMDILIVHSTVDGKYSYRNTERGTPFIKALSEELGTLVAYRQEMDIYNLLHKVNTKVALKFQAQDQSGGKQMPCFVSMLTKSLILKMKDS